LRREEMPAVWRLGGQDHESAKTDTLPTEPGICRRSCLCAGRRPSGACTWALSRCTSWLWSCTPLLRSGSRACGELACGAGTADGTRRAYSPKSGNGVPRIPAHPQAPAAYGRDPHPGPCLGMHGTPDDATLSGPHRPAVLGAAYGRVFTRSTQPRRRIADPGVLDAYAGRIRP